MKLLLAIVFTLFATAAYASCRTWTYTGPDGNTLFCTTCCFGNNCNTTCN